MRACFTAMSAAPSSQLSPLLFKSLSPSGCPAAETVKVTIVLPHFPLPSGTVAPSAQITSRSNSSDFPICVAPGRVERTLPDAVDERLAAA
jgi:hypothetical protein